MWLTSYFHYEESRRVICTGLRNYTYSPKQKPYTVVCLQLGCKYMDLIQMKVDLKSLTKTILKTYN